MDKKAEVSPLREEDLPCAAQIESATAESWSVTALRTELTVSAARCFALRRNDELLGLALWQLAADEASLLKISVESTRRGEGLGTFLLWECIRRLQKEGAMRFFLEVRRSNAPAIALYETCGFQITGVRQGFYKRPAEDALVMNREDR